MGEIMAETQNGAVPAGCKAEIEKSVLAFCGHAGLFPPAGEPFADRSGQAGPCAVPGPGPEAPRHVVAAVSGGADSMALLRILLALAPALELTVTACHVNHGLRGAAADRDESFVRQQCRALGVPLVVFSARADGTAIPENAGEDWARRLRYGYFSGLAAQGRVLVATAHTQNDQAETLLFRLARGTGVHGAAGIRPKRGLYVRPLLCLTRAQTEGYCRACGQAWVTDETNESDGYARNRLRHDALPALEAANAGAVRNINAFCGRMARLDAYFSEKAEALLAQAVAPGGTPENGPWALAALQAADPPVREAALHRLVAPVRDAEEKYVRLLEGCVAAGSGAVQLRPALRFCAAQGLLRRETGLQQPAGPAAAAPACPLAPGRYVFPGGWGVEIAVCPACFAEKTQSVHKKDLKNLADYAKIQLPCILRTRAPGDRFHPAGRSGGKTLKKWHNEQAVPEQARWQQPLLACGSRVFWIWDGGFAEGLAPDEHTAQLLRITQFKKVEDMES